MPEFVSGITCTDAHSILMYLIALAQQNGIILAGSIVSNHSTPVLSMVSGLMFPDAVPLSVIRARTAAANGQDGLLLMQNHGHGGHRYWPDLTGGVVLNAFFDPTHRCCGGLGVCSGRGPLAARLDHELADLVRRACQPLLRSCVSISLPFKSDQPG